MATMADRVAEATVKVMRGDSSGSGFRFVDPQLVVTNQHVLDGQNEPIFVANESGDTTAAEVVASSPASGRDFAVLRLRDVLTGPQRALDPSSQSPSRGDQVLFGGFPHGQPDLLVHLASVSGPHVVDGARLGFHVDGSVNNGNSGGPVVDPKSGALLGVITARRMVSGADLAGLGSAATALSEHATRMRAAGGGISIGGIDWTGLMALLAAGFGVLAAAIEANANAGIGIAYGAEWVTQECRKRSLI